MSSHETHAKAGQSDAPAHGHDHGHGAGHDSGHGSGHASGHGDDHGGLGHGPTHFWSKYVFSTDHKVIGLQFLFTSLLFVILGGALALGVRYQIAWPQQDLPYAEILPGTGPDQGRHPDAPKMTDIAAEANVALWKPGRRVETTENLLQVGGVYLAESEVRPAVKRSLGLVEAEAKLSDADKARLDAAVKDLMGKAPRLPAGAMGRFEAFEHGIAVTLTRQTRVRTPQSQPYDLTEELPAFLPRLSLMAGYKSTAAEVQVPVGRTAYEIVDGKPDTTRPIELLGQVKYRPGAQAGVFDLESTMVFPTRLQQTLVRVALSTDPVKVRDPAALAGFGIAEGERVAAVKRLEEVRASNAKIEEELAAASKPVKDRLEAAVKEHGKASPQVAAAETELAKLRSKFGRQMQRPETGVAHGVAGDAIVPAKSLKYEKQSLTSDGYATLFTMHASLMIFFVIIPTLVGTFGNFLIPLMIGARDMAFPKLNALSFWLGFPAGAIMLASFWTSGGASGGGWTMYPTLSEAQYSSHLGTTLWLLSVFIAGFSSIVGSLNYVTTTINMRAPGMSMFRMPLTVWAIFITALLQVFATPVLAAVGIMLILDRTLGTTFFLPDGGGQPLLWQHLFWFYSHPAVYIMILPAMGITSEVLAVYARKPIFGYKPMVYAMGGITGLGFIVWGHHMFQYGMNPIAGTSFMATTIMIAIPSAIKTFNWLGTLWGGNIRFTPAMLFALAFVSIFTIGGLSGIFMAAAPVDIPMHDTYFIVAHIHYVVFGGSMMGIFAGVYHWYPKMFGRHLDQRWGVIHFVLTFISLNGTFFLMHNLGIGGHPRRYATILYYPSLEHLQPLNVFMTICAMMLGAAQLPFLFNFFASLPSRLGRAMVAFSLAMLGIPMVTGLSAWGHSNPAWYMAWFTSDPVHGYSTLQRLVGNASLWFTVIGVAVWMGRCYGTGIRVAVVSTVAFIAWANAQLPLTALGFGFLYAAIATAVVFALWELGAAIKARDLLGKALWVVTLPAFLAPMLLKQDPYFWIGQPELWASRWMWVGLAAAAGLVYLLVRRPMDAFGAPAEANPWQANSLEWITTSPPLAHGNFETIPTVYRGPYEYSSPVVDDDYLPQDFELPAGVVEPSAH